MMQDPSNLLILALVLPVIGLLLTLVVGGRHAGPIALLLMLAGLAVAAALVVSVVHADDALIYDYARLLLRDARPRGRS